MSREPGSTISEKLGASAGMWAVLYLCLHYLILQGALADPSGYKVVIVTCDITGE